MCSCDFVLCNYCNTETLFWFYLVCCLVPFGFCCLFGFWCFARCFVLCYLVFWVLFSFACFDLVLLWLFARWLVVRCGLVWYKRCFGFASLLLSVCLDFGVVCVVLTVSLTFGWFCLLWVISGFV